MLWVGPRRKRSRRHNALVFKPLACARATNSLHNDIDCIHLPWHGHTLLQKPDVSWCNLCARTCVTHVPGLYRFPAFAGKTELCIGLGSPRMPRTPIRGVSSGRGPGRGCFFSTIASSQRLSKSRNHLRWQPAITARHRRPPCSPRARLKRQIAPCYSESHD